MTQFRLSPISVRLRDFSPASVTDCSVCRAYHSDDKVSDFVPSDRNYLNIRNFRRNIRYIRLPFSSLSSDVISEHLSEYSLKGNLESDMLIFNKFYYPAKYQRANIFS